MRIRFYALLVLTPLLAGFWWGVQAVPGKGYLSPLALAADLDGRQLYVAQHTDRSVAVFDTVEERVVATIEMPAPPTCLAVHPDRKRLFVTAGCPEGWIFEVDLERRAVTRRHEAGHSPCACVVSPDGGFLHYCDRFNDQVVALDITSGRETARIRAGREPIALAITRDGELLVAANHLPAGPADKSYAAATVTLIDAKAGKKITDILLPNGTTGVKGVALSPDGTEAYLTHILARYHLPTTQLERGWMNTNALTVVDLEARRVLNTVLLDDVDLGAANPWGVQVTPDGRWIAVAHAGSHVVSILDRPALLKRLRNLRNEEAKEVANDLSFLTELKHRIRLKGKGPRGLVVAGGHFYAAEYFSDSLGRVKMEEGVNRVVSLPLGPARAMTPERKGEFFFHDAGLCFQQWQSCSSCHPGGRADGLNWDLVNDGFGNPKNTKSLLLAHETPPAMITGIRDRAETAVRAGIRYIQLITRPEEDARAMDAYLRAMEPVPSPYLEGGRMSAAAKRGALVFEKAGCIRCHPPPLYTNLEKYALGPGKNQDEAFDTPTLVEVWRTAPYLFDGRAKNMETVIGRHNPEDRHGATSGLTEQEKKDLIRFLLSL